MPFFFTYVLNPGCPLGLSTSLTAPSFFLTIFLAIAASLCAASRSIFEVFNESGNGLNKQSESLYV